MAHLLSAIVQVSLPRAACLVYLSKPLMGGCCVVTGDVVVDSPGQLIHVHSEPPRFRVSVRGRKMSSNEVG